MKLSLNELRTISAALSYALAATPGVIERTRYQSVRTKVDRAVRQQKDTER